MKVLYCSPETQKNVRDSEGIDIVLKVTRLMPPGRVFAVTLRDGNISIDDFLAYAQADFENFIAHHVQIALNLKQQNGKTEEK